MSSPKINSTASFQNVKKTKKYVASTCSHIMLKDHVTLFLRVPDTATSPKDPNCVKDLIFFLPISTFSIP